jgi:hypothetical protein
MKGKRNPVYVVANGDLRLAANRQCWAEQGQMEEALEVALKTAGVKLVRAHRFDKDKAHGFIGSQKMGMDLFQLT